MHKGGFNTLQRLQVEFYVTFNYCYNKVHPRCYEGPRYASVTKAVKC